MNVPSGYTALDMVGFTDQGVYNSATAYVKNDIVHYNGNLWRCLVDDTTAVTPTEGANWTVFLAEPTSAAEDIIAPVEATATSTRIYSVGDQLILGDVLYDVKQAINIGDTLTVGTNIAAADTIVKQLAEKADSADLAAVATSGEYSDLDNLPTLGTAAAKNVPSSGNASTTEVVMGNDTRLTDARNAADVPAWAKTPNKPVYNGSEINTSTTESGTAQQSISDTVASGTSMDNVVGTMLNNDKTLDTNVTSLKETFTNNGAHNLIPYSLESLKKENTAGTWDGNVYTYDTHTFTVNDDLTITVNSTGPTSGLRIFRIYDGDDPAQLKSFVGKQFILSGCVGGSSTTYMLQGEKVATQDGSGGTIYQYNAEKTFIWLNDGSGVIPKISVAIESGKQVPSGTVISPMMRLATDTDTTYQPYAMTNQELTNENLTKSYEPVQLSTPRVSFNRVTIRKTGKIVNINFYATILIDLTSAQTTLFQIPSDIRTSTKQYAIAANINTNTAYRLEVNDNNNVNVNHGGITAGQEVVGNITYELL